jgi:deoxyribodipyrimidine photolyase-related protein
MRAYLIHPHQLYDIHTVEHLFNHFAKNEMNDLSDLDYIVIAESYLYFKQYAFHPLKIDFHQKSMHYYEAEWHDFFANLPAEKRKPKILYIPQAQLNSSADLINHLAEIGIKVIYSCDPTDDYLLKQSQKAAETIGVKMVHFPSPNFLLSRQSCHDFFTPYLEKFAQRGFVAHQNLLLMQSFYIFVRKKLKILLTEDGKAMGGQWSFDAENRKKIPTSLYPHLPIEPDVKGFSWPASRQNAKHALQEFLNTKLNQFGPYEDAILDDKAFLYHSTISAYLNVGLLSPHDVVQQTLATAEAMQTPIASLEGFLRQIIGWREYMRAIYCLFGSKIRQQNFFGFDKHLPAGFWSCETDNWLINRTLIKTQNYAYNHHIERLMILGNYMLLSRYHPDEVYQWFMEMYIDAYDWVMVPNIYSMSQYADGGLVTSKPYICGSNYLLKMSNYQTLSKELNETKWQEDFDTKYWQFLKDHRALLENNPRMKLILSHAKLKSMID